MEPIVKFFRLLYDWMVQVVMLLQETDTSIFTKSMCFQNRINRSKACRNNCTFSVTWRKHPVWAPLQSSLPSLISLPCSLNAFSSNFESCHVYLNFTKSLTILSRVICLHCKNFIFDVSTILSLLLCLQKNFIKDLLIIHLLVNKKIVKIIDY